MLHHHYYHHYWQNEMTLMKCTNCGYVQNYAGRRNLTYTCTNCKRSDIDQREAASAFLKVKRKEAKKE
jgi:predicted Zn-ribbon and HTH transcriptional regulator